MTSSLPPATMNVRGCKVCGSAIFFHLTRRGFGCDGRLCGRSRVGHAEDLGVVRPQGEIGDLARSGSFVVPRTKNGTANANMGCAFGDGIRKVTAHAHGEFDRDHARSPYFVKIVEVLSRRLVDRWNTHQALHI